MLAIMNSLNAHNFPIFQPIMMILESKFMVLERFLIKHSYHWIAAPLNIYADVSSAARGLNFGYTSSTPILCVCELRMHGESRCETHASLRAIGFKHVLILSITSHYLVSKTKLYAF